jgi:hypothetical protein
MKGYDGGDNKFMLNSYWKTSWNMLSHTTK